MTFYVLRGLSRALGVSVDDEPGRVDEGEGAGARAFGCVGVAGVRELINEDRNGSLAMGARRMGV